MGRGRKKKRKGARFCMITEAEDDVIDQNLDAIKQRKQLSLERKKADQNERKLRQ